MNYTRAYDLPRPIRVAHLIALGFAVGGAVHALAFALIRFGIYLYGPGYPTCRHPMMATADALIAWIAWRRPQWLVGALSAWVIEQTRTNGFGLLCGVVTAAILAHAFQQHARKLSKGDQVRTR